MRVETTDDFIYLNQHVSSFYTGISSVLAHTREYVLNQFPTNYFKRIMVDTTSSSNMMMRNEEDGLMKTAFPAMNIGVTVHNDYDDRTLRPLLERAELFIQNNIRQNYPRVMTDPDDNFTIGFTYEWVKNSFEFRITTDTFMSSVNLMQWIRTKLPINYFTEYIDKVPLEFELPQTIVKTIAELQGYDLTTTEGVRDLDRYLLTVGRMNSLITRKTNATTGQQSYFMSINSDIQINIDNFESPTNTIRNNLSEGEYVTSFTVTAQAYFPVSYVMKIRKPYFISRVKRTSLEDILGLENTPLVEGLVSLQLDIDLAKGDIINYTSTSGQKGTGMLFNEWRFVYGSEQKEQPVVKLFDLIEDPELKKVHSYMIDNNIDVESVFHFLGYKVAFTQSDINFIMDYENFEINIENSEFSEVLIRMYVNRAGYEAILIAMESDKYYFNKNILTYIDFIIWDPETKTNVTKKARVNFFKDKNELYDENPLKALKVNTKYGPGYIDIKPYKEDSRRKKDIALVNLGYERGLKDGELVPIVYEINIV